MASESEFGSWLKSERIKANWSLRKFAAEIGVSPTYLCHLESGNAKAPTFDRLKSIAKVLGVDCDELALFAGRIPPDVLQILQRSPKILGIVRKASQKHKGR